MLFLVKSIRIFVSTFHLGNVFFQNLPGDKMLPLGILNCVYLENQNERIIY